MEQHKNIFYSKMKEMDENYERFRSLIFHVQDHSESLGTSISSLKNEINQTTLILRDTVSCSRSPALSMLAGIHLNYCEQMESLRSTLSRYMGETRHDQAEALALYAENAMDFAAQAVRFALLVALEAIDIQPDETEENI